MSEYLRKNNNNVHVCMLDEGVMRSSAPLKTGSGHKLSSVLHQLRICLIEIAFSVVSCVPFYDIISVIV